MRLDNFKKILCLEKQKAESEAIISSLQVNESDASDRKTEIKSLKNKITELQNNANSKVKEIQKYKTEYELLEESLAKLENTKKENIELKEALSLKEDELKRTTDEKKFALDELLKQTVKSKRKIDVSGDSSASTSAAVDPVSNIWKLLCERSLREENIVNMFWKGGAGICVTFLINQYSSLIKFDSKKVFYCDILL